MSAGADPAGRSDGELVAAVRAGDRSAFAAVYDRYGPKLYDFAYATTRHREDSADAVADTFVRFAERLGQLRDPERLRPWLYAITRHECLRRLKARGRQAFDGGERLMELADSTPEPPEQAERAALRTLVWEAAGGLADRDRAMLDLHLRQGMDGAELGEAMGMSADQSYVQLNRLRAQVERSLGALLVARTNQNRCEDLDRLLTGWDGTLTPLIRKRVARHVEQCDLCSERKHALVSPLALLASVPLILVPAGLKDRVLEQAWPIAAASASGQPTPTVSTSSAAPRLGVVAAVVAGGAALLLIGGGALLGLGAAGPGPSASPTPGRPAVTLAGPGIITLTAHSLDLGTVASEGSVTIGNRGGSPLEIVVRPVDPWLSTDVATLSVRPGKSAELSIRADRSVLGPGGASGVVELVVEGVSTAIAVTLIQPSPPAVGAPEVVDIQCDAIFRTITVHADVSSETQLSSVTLFWESDAGGGGTAGSGETAMSPSGGQWSAQLGPFGEGANVTMTVEAVDARGLSAVGPTITVTMPIGVCN